MSGTGFAPTSVVIDETRSSHEDDDDVDHFYCCCSPDIALCGEDIGGDNDLGDADCDDPCERCEALIEVPCILCGYGISGPCACGRCEQ